MVPWYIDYLKLKEFKDTRSRMVILTSQNLPFFPESRWISYVKGALLVPRWRRISITRDKEFRVKKAMLTKLVTPLSFISSSSTPLPCQCFTRSLLCLCLKDTQASGPESLLLVFFLKWRLSYACKNSIKFVCFSPVSLPHVSLIFRPSWRPKEIRGRLFLLLHHPVYFKFVSIYVHSMQTGPYWLKIIKFLNSAWKF